LINHSCIYTVSLRWRFTFPSFFMTGLQSSSGNHPDHLLGTQESHWVDGQFVVLKDQKVSIFKLTWIQKILFQNTLQCVR
jgi:hypothetical protein